MSRSPASWAALPVRTAAAVALVLAVLATVTPTVGAQDEPLGSIELELVSRSPWVEPDGRADFSVRAAGRTAATTIDIAVHRPLTSVEQLDESLTADVGRRIYRSPRLPFEAIPLDAQGTRTLTLPTTTTGAGGPFLAPLRSSGVHPVVITLYAEDGTVLEVLRTPLLRLGTEEDPIAAPSLALVVDVATEPTLATDGARIPDDELERLGRLAVLLDAHPGLPFTLAVVPDTVNALRASPGDAASALLGALDSSIGDRVEERTALVMPYVPVSVATLLEAGLDGILPELLLRGTAVLTDQLGDEPSIEVWDARMDLDEAGADRVAVYGFTRALVEAPDPEDEEDEDAPRRLVDAGPRPIEDLEPLSGIVVDVATSAMLTDDAGGRADAGHVGLADLVLRDDGDRSTVVVRVDDHHPDSLLESILDLAELPGSPLTVGGLGIVGGAPLIDAEPLPWDPPPADDLGVPARRIPQLQQRIDTYAGLLPDESSRPDDLRLQLLTSVAATASAAQRRAALDAVETTMASTFDDVYLSGQIDLNLTSRQGTLPILVHNDNDFPVDVVLEVRSDRLRFPNGGLWELTITDEVQRIDVPVEALATGSVPTFVELRTPDGRVVLDSRQLNVRSTAISGVGLLLSAGALFVLVVWWGRNWRRNRSRPVMG